MMRHRQNQYSFRFNRIDERILKGPEDGFPNARLNLLSRLRKLYDAVFRSSNLGKESPAQPAGLYLEVADFVQQLFFRRLVISKRRHRKSLFTLA